MTKTERFVLGSILTICCIYLGIITAPLADGNLLSIVRNLDKINYSPFQWTPWTLRIIGIYLLILFFVTVFSRLLRKKDTDNGTTRSESK